MIYLDYSATTPVNKDVLDSFYRCSLEYLGNPNSLHKLGIDASNLIKSSTKQLNTILNIDNCDVIYTSGSSESNNLAIKGIVDLYSNRGNKIITTSLEHSSIYGPLKHLEKQGFIIQYCPLNSDGIVELDKLEKMIDDDTILVTISAVNSELGILQPIEKIGKIISKYPKCYFHTDITQAVGKIKFNLDYIDLASFSAHKYYGLKGIGVLIKKKKIKIEPIIHGGKSTTEYRSGTPSTPLIVSNAKALRLAYENIDKKYEYVQKLNIKLKDSLSKYEKVYINSSNLCIPHILNISIKGVKPESFLHALEKYNIYISTKSACSETNSYSEAVYSLSHDIDLANSSIRISLSHLTKEEEIDEFIRCFEICYMELTNLR